MKLAWLTYASIEDEQDKRAIVWLVDPRDAGYYFWKVVPIVYAELAELE